MSGLSRKKKQVINFLFQPVALERQPSNEKEVLKPESPKPALRPKPEAIPRYVPVSSIIQDVHGIHNQYPHQYTSSNLVNPQHQLALYQVRFQYYVNDLEP